MSLMLGSWNVNSIKVRIDQLVHWCNTNPIDIMGLQEIKVTNENFPTDNLRKLGLHLELFGQKQYNGLAILSKLPIAEVVRGLPGQHDDQCRYMAATIGDTRFINVYVPNGASVSSEKYAYKLAWLDSLVETISVEIGRYPKLAIVGDFNIAPNDLDVHDVSKWEGSTLTSAPERAAFNQLLSLGLFDAFRQVNPDLIAYSWWDYRTFAYKRGNGLRIDHILVSEDLMKVCQSCDIDESTRKLERPSDHAIVTATFA